MTAHETTNPPGPGNPPSSTSPADAGGAVQVAVPPAGRGKLTSAQYRVLVAIDEAISAGGWNRSRICTSTATLDRLRCAGLIASARPFAYRYHTVSITDAGRLLLKEGK
jgi:DNA-binding MarR family transcriptional regulator